MKLTLKRDIFCPTFTLGEFTLDGKHFGYSCEDTDRHMESNGTKIDGQTAIPRGKYELILSHSVRFGRIMPEVLSVPGFTGIRIHGGNTDADTHGCPLLGALRTLNGVKDCAGVNARLVQLLQEAESRDEQSYLEVK